MPRLKQKKCTLRNTFFRLQASVLFSRKIPSCIAARKTATICHYLPLLAAIRAIRYSFVIRTIRCSLAYLLFATDWLFAIRIFQISHAHGPSNGKLLVSLFSFLKSAELHARLLNYTLGITSILYMYISQLSTTSFCSALNA